MHLEIKAHNLVSIEGPALVAAIKNDFDLNISNPEKVIHGYSSQVFKAKLGEEIVFIRINKNADKYISEILGYDIFEKIGIPVPKLIAYQRYPATIGHPTMIISAAKGVSISEAYLSPESEDKVYEQLGSLLHKIHEFKIDGYGPLISKDGKTEGEYKTWGEYYKSLGAKHQKHLTYLLEQKIITEEEAETIKQVHAELAAQDMGQASILHKDLHGSHVFIEGNKISGVIDLEKIMAGDPRSDIATALIFQTDKQQAAFKKGYGNLTSDSFVIKYLLVISVGKMYFRLSRGSKEGAEKAMSIFRHALAQVDSMHGKGISS